MTDKERIKEWAEERIKQVDNPFYQTAMREIIDYIQCLDSMQEEPVSRYVSPYRDKIRIQYASIKDGIEAHASTYSWNIESLLFQQLTKEQQKLWRKEIEQAVISGGEFGVEIASDKRYEENQKHVSEELDEAAKQYAKEYLFTAEPTRSLTDHFKAGAQWQKEKDLKWLADNHKQIFNNGWAEGYEVGRDSMGEDMMKDAIPAVANPSDKEIWCDMERFNLKDGEDIKVIVIKED